MKMFALAFALVTVLFASPVLGQQPTGKPEIPPRDGRAFAQAVPEILKAGVRRAHTPGAGNASVRPARRAAIMATRGPRSCVPVSAHG